MERALDFEIGQKLSLKHRRIRTHPTGRWLTKATGFTGRLPRRFWVALKLTLILSPSLSHSPYPPIPLIRGPSELGVAASGSGVFPPDGFHQLVLEACAAASLLEETNLRGGWMVAGRRSPRGSVLPDAGNQRRRIHAPRHQSRFPERKSRQHGAENAPRRRP